MAIFNDSKKRKSDKASAIKKTHKKSKQIYAPTVVSLFSGCGGLDLGFKNAGFNLIWANEIMSDAAKSYEMNLGHSPVVEDIWKIIDKVPKADVVIGGPPCQAFSLVGKRLENDPRAKLVFAYQTVINLLRPKAFVMENVPGLMASKIDGQRLIDYLAENYKAAGYDITINHLLASDYFVPQRRKRVVMVGVRKGMKAFKMISPATFGELIGLSDQQAPVTAFDAIGDLPQVKAKGDYSEVRYNSPAHSSYAKLMRKGVGEAVTFHAMPTMSKLDKEFVRHIPPGGNYMDIPDAISTKRIMNFKKTGGRTTTYGRLSPDAPAYTITTYFNRPNVGANYHYSAERLISVREALRLQSFPDNFQPFYTNQRSLHMQVGNAVPPLLAYALAESLMDVIND